jgi:hypothetical protein
MRKRRGLWGELREGDADEVGDGEGEAYNFLSVCRMDRVVFVHSLLFTRYKCRHVIMGCISTRYKCEDNTFVPGMEEEASTQRYEGTFVRRAKITRYK